MYHKFKLTCARKTGFARNYRLLFVRGLFKLCRLMILSAGDYIWISSICTAQVVLNASVAHLAATHWLSMCHLEWEKPLSMGSFLMERIFRSTPNMQSSDGTYWVVARCVTEAFSTTCARLWGLVVVQLLWLSGRKLAAQARGVLGLTPSGCRPFHFRLFLPHNI